MLPLAIGLLAPAVVVVVRTGAVVRGGREEEEVGFVGAGTGGARVVLTVDVSDAADDARDWRAATVDSGDLRGVPLIEGVATGRLKVLFELPETRGFGRVVVVAAGLLGAVEVEPRRRVEGLVEVEVLSGFGREVLEPRAEVTGFFVGAAVRVTSFFGAGAGSGVGAFVVWAGTSNGASVSRTVGSVPSQLGCSLLER